MLVVLEQQEPLKLLFGEVDDVFRLEQLAVTFKSGFLGGDFNWLALASWKEVAMPLRVSWELLDLAYAAVGVRATGCQVDAEHVEKWGGPMVQRLALPPSCAISNHMASDEDLKAEIERLRAKNEALKKPRGQMSLKVSQKGRLSVYGLGRFPVTLYREQWEKLLGMADEIRNFIRENDRDLKKME
jgi:hypothetical protein